MNDHFADLPDPTTIRTALAAVARATTERPPDPDHLHVLTRVATAHLDGQGERSRSPRALRERLEERKRNMTTLVLTRAEVLAAIDDLEAALDLLDLPTAVPDDVADAARILSTMATDDSRVVAAQRSLRRGLLGEGGVEGAEPAWQARLRTARPPGDGSLVLVADVDAQTLAAVADGLWNAIPFGPDKPQVGDTLVLTNDRRRFYARVERRDDGVGTLVVLGRFPASHGQIVHGETGSHDHRGIYAD